MGDRADEAGPSSRRCSNVSVKGRDCWWTVVVVDPLAGPLVRLVCPLPWITPNVLTAASVAVAFAAAVAYASNRLLLGGILFQVSFLLDCMDGKLAHTKGAKSAYGGYIDSVGDALRFASCMGGLAFALAANETDAAGWMAVLALFPTLHYAVFATQAAWPREPKSEPLSLPASPLAFLRAAPGRLSKPGTTVDTEALAFTIGPVVGLPLAGVLAATVVDGARLIVSVLIRVRSIAAAS